MTMLQVLYVLEVAGHGSISKAAENLYVSQPALSLQIKRLEQELGCELFDRRPQGVRLTVAGELFCQDAQVAAKAWKQLQERAKQINAATRRELRIGLGPRALASGIFNQVALFFDQYPETEVTYLTDMGDQIIAALEDKRIDLAFDRIPPKEVGLTLEHIAAFELFQERQCVLLSREDPRADLPEIALTDLDGSVLVSSSEISLDNSVMKTHGVQALKVRRTDNLEVATALIRGGKGVALGSASFARRYHVAAVPTLPPDYVALNLLCRKQDAKIPLIHRLKEYLTKNPGV